MIRPCTSRTKTIYLSLFIQSRGVLKKALQAQLRPRHTIRRPRTAARKAGGYIVGAGRDSGAARHR